MVIIMAAQNMKVTTAPLADEFVCLLKSGATITWKLTEEPKVELLEGQFVISSARSTVYYAAEDVSRFNLQKSSTDIKPIPSAKVKIQQTEAGQLFISGCRADEEVVIYATDGKQLLRSHANKDGMLTLSTDALPAGVYIVKSQSVNLKLAKR